MSGCHNPEMGLQNLFNMIVELKNRVEGLHENKLNQIELNKIAYDWLSKLEQSREAGSRSHKDIFERLDKIEQYIKMEDRVTASSVLSRLNELESKIACLMQMSNLNCEKRPFSCPVCNGTKKELFTLPAGGYYEHACKICSGEGIVWG